MNNAVQHTILYERKSGKITHLEKKTAQVDESSFAHIVESHVIGLYPEYTFQTVDGFGCAMTETSCYLLSRMPAKERREALSLWFGPGPKKAKFIRIPMDSCDYSLSEYQAVEDPIADPELNSFSLKRDKEYILPVVKEAIAMSEGNLSVLMSPWSPPWQWKTPPLQQGNDSTAYGGQEAKENHAASRNNGGSLKPEYYSSWAKYLVKYLKGYLEEGIPVTMLSIQNEAAAATPWDSCVWTGEQERNFLVNHLYPELDAADLTGKIEIFVWDHNKERKNEHITEVMDEKSEPMIDGFAYHWYTGDHFETLSLLGRRFPGKILMHSESCPLHRPGKTTAQDMDIEKIRKMPRASLAPEILAVLDQMEEKTPKDVDLEDAFAYAHDMIGDLNHGMHRWIDWNMIVDQNGGPRHVEGGFAAPLICDTDGRVHRTITHHYLSLIMETIPAGSVRIGHSEYGASIEVTAVRIPTGEINVLILHQGIKEENANLRIHGKVITVTLQPESLTSISIEEESAKI